MDHPWEETVVKVNKKIFVFLASADIPTWPAITVKLQVRTRRPSAFQRESLDGVVPEAIDNDDYWVRIVIGSVIRSTVNPAANARPIASELMEHLEEVFETIDRRSRGEAASGRILIWDTLGPRDSYSPSGSRSLTAPPRGNPPNFGELALRFLVPDGPPLVLGDVSVPLSVWAGRDSFT